MSIQSLLTELDSWFNESGLSSERAKLLSKLAILEYCGWLEERLDEVVLKVSGVCGVASCNSVINAVKSTYGFTYHAHLREMLVIVLGERGVGAAEALMNLTHPNDLEALISSLGMLRAVRGHLAHNSSLAPVPQQVTLYAPSWCINQQRISARRIDRLESHLVDISNAINTAI